MLICSAKFESDKPKSNVMESTHPPDEFWKWTFQSSPSAPGTVPTTVYSSNELWPSYSTEIENSAF